MKLAKACALSDTIFGNLIRFHSAVDTELLYALILVLERDGQSHPLELNEPAVLNLVAACDIARKMFSCDAADAVIRQEKITMMNNTIRENLIDFSNVIINDLIKNGTYGRQISELLIQLDETIQP